MRATLEFQLPEERSEHMVAVHAMDFALTVFDLEEELRLWMKHGHKFSSADEVIEAVRQKLHECLENRGASLDMIS